MKTDLAAHFLVSCTILLLSSGLHAMPMAPTPAPGGTLPQGTLPTPGISNMPTNPLPQASQMSAPSSIPSAFPTANPTPQPATTFPTAPQNQSINAQTLELNALLKEIEVLKQGLVALLKDFDARLLDSSKKALEAKNLTYALLNESSEAQAKEHYARIQAIDQDVLDMQQFMQNKFSQDYNDKMSMLRVKAAQAETLIKAFNTMQTQSALKASINNQMPQQAAPTAKNSNPSLMDKITSLIATGIKKIAGNDSSKKKTVIAKSDIPSDANQRIQEANNSMRIIEQNLQIINTTRADMQKYFIVMKQNTSYIETLVNQSPEGAKMLQECKEAVKPKVEPAWKTNTLMAVGLVLDGVGQAASNIYSLFDATIGSFSRHLIKDVKKKLTA